MVSCRLNYRLKLQPGGPQQVNGTSGLGECVVPTASWLGQGFVHKEEVTLQGCVLAAGTEVHS